MNKVVDQRILPEGEYVDAMNIRMGSTENSEVGVIENTKGNLSLTELTYIDGTPLSVDARCIGAIADAANENVYWFVHDPSFGLGATGKLDLVVSFNVKIGLVDVSVTFKLFLNLKKLNNKPRSFAVTAGKVIVRDVSDWFIVLIIFVFCNGNDNTTVVSLVIFCISFNFFLVLNNKLEFILVKDDVVPILTFPVV